MKKLFAKDLIPDQSITEVFYVRTAGTSLTRNNSEYLWGILEDKTGTIQFRKWAASATDIATIKEGIFLKIRAATKSYQGSTQLTIERAEEVTVEDPSDFFRTTEHDIDSLVKELKDFIEAFKNEKLKTLLQEIYNDEFIEQFKVHPAASEMHHAYIGGLLEHTVFMCREATVMAEANPRLDLAPLLTGCLLHDIGKVWEISSRGEYTVVGNLVGHIVLAMLHVNPIMIRLKFSDELRWTVLHLIGSHHGRHEWGSPVIPQFTEAYTLHCIDQIDAKAQSAEEALRRTDKDSDFTPKVWSYDNKPLYTRKPWNE